MEHKEKAWHREALAPEAMRTLLALKEEAILEDFYLAGGTSLALHLGHRRSLDLDYFRERPFDVEALLAKVERLPEISRVEKHSQTLHASIQGTKVSFLGYNYPLLFPVASFLATSVADVRDTACMKISAILSRGKKRDFIDLYVVSQHYGLATLIEMFQRKFAKTNYNLVSVLKSLTYFEDAEDDPMPDMLAQISWGDVKRFFSKEVLPLR